MNFRIRRPLIWALGLMVLVLMIFNALGKPVFFRTPLDDEMGVMEDGTNKAQVTGESGSVPASLLARVKNITKSKAGYKVTLDECEVSLGQVFTPHGVVAYVDDVEKIMVGDKVSMSGKLSCINRPDNPRRI